MFLFVNFFPRHLEKKYDKVCEFCKKHKTRIHYVVYGILITGTVCITSRIAEALFIYLYRL